MKSVNVLKAELNQARESNVHRLDEIREDTLNMLRSEFRKGGDISPELVDHLEFMKREYTQ